MRGNSPDLFLLIRRTVPEQTRDEDLAAVARLAREVRELAERRLGGTVVVDYIGDRDN